MGVGVNLSMALHSTVRLELQKENPETTSNAGPQIVAHIRGHIVPPHSDRALKQSQKGAILNLQASCCETNSEYEAVMAC